VFSIGLNATSLDRRSRALGRWFNMGMRETAADLAALQALLDRSFAAGGTHLLRILTPERRLTAEQVAERLTGMVLLALATVTADGRPIVGPVDGIFLHGAFHFGSAPDSLRFRHIRARPPVSATHLPGEELSVTVHGRAVPVDVHSEEGAELKSALLEIYVPRYGPQWERFLDSGVAYARIEAERMFTFHMEPGGDQTS
jgi:nitroimidazol reductase NimA-like FMN-containing flavoprotein (pyridoxamine 5'-phosphate oxidase superfamily)